MILDNTAIFSDAQAITATARSTNIIDLKAAGVPYGASAAVGADIGKGGCGIALDVRVVEDFNNLTSLQVSVEVDDNTSTSSPTVVAMGPAVPLATLKAGYQFPFPAELMEGVNEQYVNLRYTVVGTAPTTGKITAAVVAARQQQ